MEDNFESGINDFIKNAQSDLDNFKRLQDAEYDKLTEAQKKQLDDAMKGIDMKQLNDVIAESTTNIINHINNMFK